MANVATWALNKFSLTRVRTKLPGALVNLRYLESGEGVARELSVLRRLGFEKVFRFHGIAVNFKGNTTVVAGPGGIGKTSLGKKVEEKGGKFLADGSVLVGFKDGKYYFIDAGVEPLTRNFAGIQRALRASTDYQSPFAGETGVFSGFFRKLGHYTISAVSHFLAAMKLHQQTEYEPRWTELNRIVLFNNNTEPRKPITWNQNGEPAKVNLQENFPAGFVKEINTDKLRRITRSDLEQMFRR